MSSVDIRPVRTARERHAFLTFPWRIYRQDPLWVPPLIPEMAKRLDPKKGAFLQRGEAEFYVAWRDAEPVGTICTGEDRPPGEFRGARECVFGFLEYIEDYQVFAALMAQAISWAEQRGLHTLWGPFNLDYEDSYGVLIEGRDRPPALMCGHTPPYYQHFMERYGFGPARGDNLAYAIYPGSPAFQRVSRLAERVRRRGQITVRGARFARWDEEIDRVHALLNECLAHLPDHIGWHRESLEALARPFRQIADPDLVLFAEIGDKTVGWFPAVPNLNEVFIRVNGLRWQWDYLKLWWLMQRPTESLTIKSVLVKPEYWNTGVAVLLFDEMAKRAVPKGYRWADLSLTSEDNPNTPLLAEHAGLTVYKRYRVYRLAIHNAGAPPDASD